MRETSMINEETIKNKIYSIRGFQVMLDKDLAELYISHEMGIKKMFEGVAEV
jgi:hypothetical protein